MISSSLSGRQPCRLAQTKPSPLAISSQEHIERSCMFAASFYLHCSPHHGLPFSHCDASHRIAVLISQFVSLGRPLCNRSLTLITMFPSVREAFEVSAIVVTPLTYAKPKTSVPLNHTPQVTVERTTSIVLTLHHHNPFNDTQCMM